ncbi:hypothetical protein ACFYXD_35275 [Streptomyces platensis]|uniref:hypothetical protein n=1 Tax=Streptomyces platensis TaxID=58346 RepID=UPI00369F4812
MPKDHARKKALATIKDELGIKHACAIALLDHPDADERETLEQYLAEYVDINTYREAVDYLHNDPRRQVLCETCGWSVAMVCPECPGCGCYNGQCSGWRHSEYAHEDDDYDDPDRNVYCQDCGAGSSSPYDECTCWEDDEEQDEAAPDPSPELIALPSHGGWGSSSVPLPASGS